MQLTVGTEKLKEMVSKAVKGASNNKLMPITSLISIEYTKDEGLRLTTTDGTNYLYVTDSTDFGDEDFSVVVGVDKLSKLVFKTTSPTITLDHRAQGLRVQGNGSYIIELPLDEIGNEIEFPDPVGVIDTETEFTEVSTAILKLATGVCKNALASEVADVAYMNYYFGDNVVATDTMKISAVKIDLLKDKVLVTPEMANLFSVITSDTVKYARFDDNILFIADDAMIYGYAADGVEDYAFDAISELVNQDFRYSCVVNRGELLEALERVGLFVGKYDDNEIRLVFTEKGLQINSKRDNGAESLDYVEATKVEPFTCKIDIQMFYEQLKSNTASDKVTILFGEPNSIKFVDGNIIHIVALIEE